MTKKNVLAIMLVVIFFIIAATSIDVQAKTVVLPPTPAPSPSETPISPKGCLPDCYQVHLPMVAKKMGVRTLSGKLIYADGTPKIDAVMRLGKVDYCDADGCYYSINGGSSPATVTNNDGEFVFSEIAPLVYVLLVHNLFTDIWWILADDETGQEMWSVVADDLDVGTIIFDGDTSEVEMMEEDKSYDDKE